MRPAGLSTSSILITARTFITVPKVTPHGRGAGFGYRPLYKA
jgi:hypothetical protein